MALYGTVLATSSGGAIVSVERLTGWSRQLRITLLQPAAYIAIKMATSLVLGLVAVLAVYVAGVLTHKPSMPVDVWVATGAALWIGSLLFAAFGLFVGYLLPSENVMQLIGIALMLFSFGGGLFISLSQFSHLLRVLAAYTPLYGLNQLADCSGSAGSLR
ncbi:MAG: ABC transporter permease [Acidimicrobiales bacterium]